MNEWVARLSTVSPFALAVSAVAFTFLLVSQKMLTQYEQLAGRAFARSNSRWRFYSIFAAMMLSAGMLALGYAVFAKAGFYTALASGNLWAWTFVVMGWVPLPALLLELALAQHVDALGFTQLYEGNIQRLPGRSFLRRWIQRLVLAELAENDRASQSVGRARFLDIKRQRSWIALSFLIRWLLTYAVASALGVHVRTNAQRNADFPVFAGNVQAREDWIVLFVSLVWMLLILLTPVFLLFSYFDFASATPALVFAWIMLFSLGLIQVSATFFGFDILTKRAPNWPVDKIAPYALLFLFLAGVFDILMELWVQTPTTPEGPFQKAIVTIVVIWRWFGGAVPIVLLIFLTGTIRRFLEDIARSRESELERVQTAMAANLIGLGLHHFGNKFSAVRALTSEIKQFGAPPTDPERQRQVWNSLNRFAQIADNALDEADKLLGGLKRDVRRTAMEPDSMVQCH